MVAKVVVFALCCFAVFQHLEATYLGMCPDASGGATNAVCPLACQFSNNGSFTPNAFDCEDDLGSSVCTTLFPCSGGCSTINGLSTVAAMVPTTQPYVRAYGCTAPATQSLALQCAKTCGICCLTAKFNCTDDSRSPINCAANQGNCRNAAFKDIMTQYCPFTCGLCGGNCKDNATGCSTLSGLCQNINWYQYMSQNCASTCGMCNSTTTNSTTGSCSDVATNCAANANLCNNSVYYSLMTQQCPKTCNRCGQSSSSSTTCTDSSANCATWAKNGFCSSTFYNSTYKKQYCAKTCSLC